MAPATSSRLKAVDDGDFSFVEIYQTLQKRKLTIVLCTLVCVGLALAASLYTTPKYEATATIEVNKASSDMLGLDSLSGLAGGGSDGLDSNIALKTEAAVLKGDSLLFRVAEQLGLEKRKEFALKPSWLNPASRRQIQELNELPLEKSPARRAKIHSVFEKNLTVDLVSSTRLIEVKFLSPDPQVAADVVNTLVNDYLEQYFRTRYAATAQASDWLSKQLSDLKDQVDESQQKLNKLQDQAGILGVVLPSGASGSLAGGKEGGYGGSMSAWPAMD